MKDYDVKVKIISQSKFEVEAENEDEAVGMVEKIVLDTVFLSLNLDDKKVEIEVTEKDVENECEDCEYYCKTCGCCMNDED